MQPDNSVGNNAKPEMPQGAPGGIATENDNVAVKGMSEEIKAPRKNTAMILGMVLLAVLAAGGIGFGVWAMLDGNAQKDKLNLQISDLGKQNIELSEQISELRSSNNTIEDDTDDGDVNPIISSQDSSVSDRVSFVSTGNPRIRITIDEGNLLGCSYESDEDRDGSWDVKECSLGDLGGKVYKVVAFGGTQEFDPYIGFIMTDGSVRYLSFYGVMNNGDYTLKTLNLDGKVVDAIKVTTGQKGATAGGFITNVFVLADGTVLKFDESMVAQ